MKTFFIARLFFIGFLSFPAFSVQATSNPLTEEFWQTDKRKHFVVSAAVSGASYTALRMNGYNRWESLITSVALGVLVGTAKEVYDRQVDSDDIKADFAGAASAGGLFFTFDFLFF